MSGTVFSGHVTWAQKGPLQDYNIINYKTKIYINYIVYVKYTLKLKLKATNYNKKKNYKTT